jgi:SAM-dependent methyltransferase
MMSLDQRASGPERMDADDLDPAIYAEVLADLGQVNAITLARRPTLRFIARTLAGRRSFRLLDVGFGHGDMLRAIARWAKHRNIAADLVGIDLNANSAPAARAATPDDAAIDYRTGDYADLAGEGFDLIVSSLVAHHMSADELREFRALHGTGGHARLDGQRSAPAPAGTYRLSHSRAGNGLA